MDDPQRFLFLGFLFFFVFFFRKIVKQQTVIWGSGDMGPTDLSCLAPEAALTLPTPRGGPLG